MTENGVRPAPAARTSGRQIAVVVAIVVLVLVAIVSRIVHVERAYTRTDAANIAAARTCKVVREEMATARPDSTAIVRSGSTLTGSWTSLKVQTQQLGAALDAGDRARSAAVVRDITAACATIPQSAVNRADRDDA